MPDNLYYIPGLGYCFKSNNHWYSLHDGKPALLPPGLDPPTMARAFYDAVGNKIAVAVFDNPTPKARLLTAWNGNSLATGVIADYIHFDVEAREIMVWRDCFWGTTRSADILHTNQADIEIWKDMELIYAHGALPTGGAVLNYRKTYHGAFTFRIQIHNNTAGTIYPYVGISAWAVPEEEYNRVYQS